MYLFNTAKHNSAACTDSTASFSAFPFFLQKADGTCNTNFKKTKHREQVMQALEDFVDGNTEILVCY